MSTYRRVQTVARGCYKKNTTPLCFSEAMISLATLATLAILDFPGHNQPMPFLEDVREETRNGVAASRCREGVRRDVRSPIGFP